MEKSSRVVLLLNIKIDNTRNEDVPIYENDEPEDVAEQFCKKFNLPDIAKQFIIKSIEDNLDNYIIEELGKTTNNLSSITSHAKKLSSPLNCHRKSESNQNYGEFLYTKGLMMKQKVENMMQAKRQNILDIEMKNSTFKPKITPFVGRMRTASAEYSKKRSQKMIEDQNTYTFKPKINNYRGKSKENKEKTDKCVELFNSAVAIKQKLDSKREKMFNEIYTFKPDVTKKKIINSDIECVKPKDYLNKVKIQQLKKFFRMLCPDSKGCITKNTVCNAIISENDYKLIGRIVDELIELDESLNFEEFCKAMEILEKEVNEKNIQNPGAKVEGELN
ncbi:hypothetical protein SteCoe_2334 [Stentor coeruleus]|uniref:EF-hand domain-containing protein n=1 Tax=Stentor coeruleus TaxID=5963 RepID=A0A1R2CZK6_9CILI|nr:hypothetical protein SteCoe_2334 [Stentor coeruleus]